MSCDVSLEHERVVMFMHALRQRIKLHAFMVVTTDLGAGWVRRLLTNVNVNKGTGSTMSLKRFKVGLNWS